MDQQPQVIDRNPPEPERGRVEFITSWCDRIKEAEGVYDETFKQMRRDMEFVHGKQWPTAGDKYVANVTLRHINQRVAAIYAKNPRVVAKRRKRLEHTLWDGNPETLAMAQASMAGPQMDPMTGAVTQPPMDPVQAVALLQEFEQVRANKEMLNRVGKTLELAAQYTLDEPIPKFKNQAKQLVRRALTCKVGYVKLGFQRQMTYSADQDARLKDAVSKLERIQELAANLADKTIEPGGKEEEELRALIQQIQANPEQVVREGVIFGFPRAWSIIPDPACTQLRGFVGAEWIAEKMLLSPSQVQRIYKKDVSRNYSAYTATGQRGDKRKRSDKFCAVYEVYDLIGRQMFTLCDGYNDYLREPGEPDVTLEQFHPFYSLVFNEVEDSEDIYPQSQVELVRPMAEEINRSREALRQHRIANRPAWMAPKGTFDDDSKQKLGDHADHEVIEHKLGKTTKIQDVIQPKPTAPIDAALYDTEQAFIDLLRATGDQEANLGGTSGTSATESTIAETTRATGIQSAVDDLDEFLTDLMRGVGQVLLKEMSPETAKKIAGPGAVWPEMSRQEIAEELYLEIKAGSSGRPNRTMRIAAIEKTAPFLMQVPGIKPRWLAEFMLTELDEGIEIEDAIEDGMPSITALNALQSKPAPDPMAAAPGGEGGSGGVNRGPSLEPGAQGPQGAQNAQAPQQSGAKTQGLYRMAPPVTAGNEVAAA